VHGVVGRLHHFGNAQISRRSFIGLYTEQAYCDVRYSCCGYFLFNWIINVLLEFPLIIGVEINSQSDQVTFLVMRIPKSSLREIVVPKSSIKLKAGGTPGFFR
jgi:hypothetical protein